MHVLLRVSCSVTALVAIGAFGTQARAQASGGAQSAQQSVDDIIVTAQRREERLQDVPVAVTVFSGEELERRQIDTVQDLLNTTPGATFSATFYGQNDMIIAIRGVPPSGSQPNVDQAAATYIDGLYYARSQLTNFAAIDLERAEVLRGPQGTLFGRNSIGGALNITTRGPTDKFEGLASVSYGNFNAIDATGIVNLPLSADWGLRLVYSHQEHDGYAYNVTTRSPMDDQNSDFVRATIAGSIGSAITARLTFDYTDDSRHNGYYHFDYLDPVIAGTATYNLLVPYLQTQESRRSAAGFNPVNNSHAYNITGRVTADLGAATLTSITGYRNIKHEAGFDLDATPVQLQDIYAIFDGDQFSQELQLAGEGFGNKLTWQVGAYYFTESVYFGQTVAATNVVLERTDAVKNDSISGFGQATFEIVPSVRLTAGARYVHDTRKITYYNPIYALASPPAAPFNATSTSRNPGALLQCPLVGNGVVAPGAPCRWTPAKIDFDYVPWTVGIDFKPNDDTLLYAKIAKGFRSGGFQQPAGATPNSYYTPFNPENVLSYEGGVKLTLFDRRLTFNAAAYHTRYNDIQQNNVIPNTSPVTIQLLNVGAATINGLELEAAARLGGLRLSGSFSTLDPDFTSGPYKGSEFPTVAKQTFSLSADLPVDVGVGMLTLHAGYDHKSSVVFLNMVNVNVTPPVRYNATQIASMTQPAFGLLNLKATLELRDVPLTLSVWGKNVTDEFYAVRTGTNFGSFFNDRLIGAPATCGVTLAYRFGK